MATRSPYANGPGAVEAIKNAKRPGFKDLIDRATAAAEEKEAAAPPRRKVEEPVVREEGIKMGGTPYAVNGVDYDSIHFGKGGATPEQRAAMEANQLPMEEPNLLLYSPAAEATTTANQQNFDPLAPFDGEGMVPGLHAAPAAMRAEPEPEPCKTCEFYAVSEKITLTLEAGEFVIKAVDVRTTQYSVAVMVPTEGTTVFIPKPGTQITLTRGEQSYDVYFPGTYANYDELGVMVLLFVRADQE